MKDVYVRQAVPQDAAAIGNILHEAWLATYPNEELGITREGIELIGMNSEEQRIRRFKKLTTPDEASERIVAEVGGKVVGESVVHYGPDYATLRALYVLPEYWSKGVGSALMTRVLELTEPYGRVYLGVASYNDRAIRFYERFGFVRTEEGPDFPGSPNPGGIVIPEIHMVRLNQKG